ncbi:Hypothetical protein Minf_0588 [Methylacidiphilum infernorum V4]|uniref:Uncharacterized protein n=1 Tax=Methylacidiphilum infernorum (isolate V4) TaxID=481448 RepID=B3DZY5_METI4|nr:Hypothetical protein Minf_0588 [Methylacidiphilum infernorum V4]
MKRKVVFFGKAENIPGFLDFFSLSYRIDFSLQNSLAFSLFSLGLLKTRRLKLA